MEPRPTRGEGDAPIPVLYDNGAVLTLIGEDDIGVYMAREGDTLVLSIHLNRNSTDETWAVSRSVRLAVTAPGGGPT